MTSRLVIVTIVLFCCLELMTTGQQLTRGEWSEAKKKAKNVRAVNVEAGGMVMGYDKRELLKTGEYPLKNIRVKPFRIDKYLVTNADFKSFSKDKPRYVTQAEKAGYSWVFVRHKEDGATHDDSMQHKDGSHWLAVVNANWKQPFGPGSSVEDKPKHPVVHMSYYEAYSYCMWAGKRLLTEYEWEYAARGGQNGTRFPWGNKTEALRSNIWQGRFPDYNLVNDGYDGPSPVDAFPEQNDFGLHDMVGNVWEWTSTVFTIPRVQNDPSNPEFTVKGGSYLDLYDTLTGHEVRNSARLGFNASYSAANLGFRCGEANRPELRETVVHRLADTWDYKVKQMWREWPGPSGPFREDL